MPEAGSYAHCPKRTGFNTLLFGEVTTDSCSDGACYNLKLSQCIERRIAENPKLVQITREWKSRGDGRILGRNRYIALNLAVCRKSKAPLSSVQKPCKHISDAIVVEGHERGSIMKVCAELNCPIHFADRRVPDPERAAKEREQRRKELLRQKLETTVRYRTLTEILQKIGTPMERADLVFVAGACLHKLEPLRQELLARRHKLVAGTASEVTFPQVRQAMAKLLRQSDEAALSKLLVEIILLEAVDKTAKDEQDVLMVAAKRHQVDVDRLSKAVEREFAAKRAKRTARQNKAIKKGTTTAA